MRNSSHIIYETPSGFNHQQLDQTLPTAQVTGRTMLTLSILQIKKLSLKELKSQFKPHLLRKVTPDYLSPLVRSPCSGPCHTPIIFPS